METHEDFEHMPVTALRTAAESMPDQARADVRRRVMSTIQPRTRSGFFLAQSRRIAAAVTAATVLFGGGVAYAANGSLPGSTLYPVKRAVENAIVAVLPTGSLERQVLVGLAERRAEEAGALARRTGATQADVAGVLEQLRDSVHIAGGVTGLQEQELLRIQSRIGEVPDWAQTAIEKAISAENDAQQGAGSAGPSNEGAGSSGGSGTPQEPAPGSGSSGSGSGGGVSGSDSSTGSAGSGGQIQQNGTQRGLGN
ncbi:MAG: hypothetical protein HGA39_07405 [Coriobacteriia bacterium]|nr:hypothetical protein [Coriobacteriia bacterium]